MRPVSGACHQHDIVAVHHLRYDTPLTELLIKPCTAHAERCQAYVDLGVIESSPAVIHRAQSSSCDLIKAMACLFMLMLLRLHAEEVRHRVSGCRIAVRSSAGVSMFSLIAFLRLIVTHHFFGDLSSCRAAYYLDARDAHDPSVECGEVITPGFYYAAAMLPHYPLIYIKARHQDV